MRPHHPFLEDDLEALDSLLTAADGVVAMADVLAGDRSNRVIGMRHDVDNFIEPAVEMARWEAERGYRSTYFILHSAPYWQDKILLTESLDTIADLGHEIGIHNNALAESWTTGQAPEPILMKAIKELRGYGYHIEGTVAHGDRRCYDATGNVRFVNDQIFRECPRPEYDWKPNNSLADFGLSYDANWIGRGKYLSDSGGKWSDPGFDAIADGFPFDGQLHMLVHPDWWTQAFEHGLGVQIAQASANFRGGIS